MVASSRRGAASPTGHGAGKASMAIEAWAPSPADSPHSSGSSPGRVLRLEDITIIKRR